MPLPKLYHFYNIQKLFWVFIIYVVLLCALTLKGKDVKRKELRTIFTFNICRYGLNTEGEINYNRWWLVTWEKKLRGEKHQEAFMLWTNQALNVLSLIIWNFKYKINWKIYNISKMRMQLFKKSFLVLRYYPLSCLDSLVSYLLFVLTLFFFPLLFIDWKNLQKINTKITT